MRDESIEAEQQAAAKDGDAVVKALTQAGGPDGDGAVGQPSYHDGVHDAHAHPADFGDDERQGQAQGQDKVRAPRDDRSGLRFDSHQFHCDYINWLLLAWRGRLAREKGGRKYAAVGSGNGRHVQKVWAGREDLGSTSEAAGNGMSL